ncbi:PREDICTED: bone morphogenetic protein 15 [Nanorana parkeri]|uniref:bone morphogenetic protein 15 n=1 Tax=Nanorana parkeri TaxID=125878 RepID=UPI000854ADC7|nr:PREDICTED: bone morphogenetic protein 15 [Nanorana parkeri]
MMLGPPQDFLLLWLFIVALPAAAERKSVSALMRCDALPLIQTLLDHGPLEPRTVAKHDLSSQHLHFMLALYRRSADGDGRPKTSKVPGAAVRLVRPAHQTSFITEGPWWIEDLAFNLHAVKAEELQRATVIHPRALHFKDNYYLCKVDLTPSVGISSKTRVPRGMRKWMETDLTSYVKPLVEQRDHVLHVQMSCRQARKRPRVSLALSPTHIPFLLMYFNHTVHNRSKENAVTVHPAKSKLDLPVRKRRRAEAIGIKLPKIAKQGGQSNNRCSLHPLWVSFHQLGWDHWIIAPHRYNPGFCKGDCPQILHSGYNSPNHAIIQNFISQVVDENVPRPSCVPYSYGPISVLMIEPGGNILYKEYENMMAESCTCR